MRRLRYPWFSAAIDAIATKIVTERPIGVTSSRTSRPLANFRPRTQATTIWRITFSRRNASGESGSSRQVFNLGLRFDHSSGNRFINRTSGFPAKACTGYSGYALPRLTVSRATVTALSTLTLTSPAIAAVASIATITPVTPIAAITPPAGVTSIASAAAVIWMVTSIMS